MKNEIASSLLIVRVKPTDKKKWTVAAGGNLSKWVVKKLNESYLQEQKLN